MEVSADGKRPSLRRATAIDPGWLAESAASLTILSQPQLELAPRYDPAADEALAWCVPTYGKAAWTLPVVARPPPRQPRSRRRRLRPSQRESALQLFAARLHSANELVLETRPSLLRPPFDHSDLKIAPKSPGKSCPKHSK